jgi:4-amino-4-deoxy-L-arabinose transferase-like glycosyltransferase
LLVIYEIGFLLGGASLLIFFLGHLGFIGATTLFGVAILVLAGLIFLSIRHLKKEPIKLSGTTRWCIILLSLFVLVVFPILILPPTARDELIVHLAVPKFYLENGRIVEIPFMGFSYAPMNIDLLYLIPMALGSDTIPKLIHFCFALLTGLVIYLYLAERHGRGYATLGLFLYITTPIVVMLSTTAYIDLGLTFYSTLALVALLKWRETGYTDKWLLYSAISTGLALGTKYSALVILFILGISVPYLYSRATKKQAIALGLGIKYVSISLAVFLPWLVKNYLLKGNPIYPVANWLFAAGASIKEGFHISVFPPLLMRKLLYGEDLWYILLLPFRIFWEGQDGSHQYFDGVLNPLYLLFIPFAFVRAKDRDVRYMTFFSFLFFYVAFFTVDIVTRYLLPIIPVLIIFIVFGFCNLSKIKRFKNIAALLMAGLFIFNGWYLVELYRRYRPLQYLIGYETRDKYLSRRLSDYPTISFANSVLPDNARVMLIFAGDRGYYWEREYYYGPRSAQDIIRFIKGSSNEVELKEHFRGLGMTHLFIRDPLFIKFCKDNLDREELEVLNRFYRTQLKTLYSRNGYSLYEVL